MSDSNARYPKSYGDWAGNPNGIPPDFKRCCEEVRIPGRWASYAQCQRSRGHGPDKAYCKQHDPEAVGDLEVALSRIRGKADRDIMIEYGSVGARHLQHLADLATLPDTALRIHASQIGAATAQSYDDTLQKLKMMLMTHAQEWRTFLSAQGEQSFLRGWMEGGRYGRFE